MSDSGITDEGISILTKLANLDLSKNDLITNQGISGLISPRTLKLSHNNNITNEGISKLTNLTDIGLYKKEK